MKWWQLLVGALDTPPPQCFLSGLRLMLPTTARKTATLFQNRVEATFLLGPVSSCSIVLYERRKAVAG
jgi:hypothetical protein